MVVWSEVTKTMEFEYQVSSYKNYSPKTFHCR